MEEEGNGVVETSIRKTVKDSKGLSLEKRVAEREGSVAEHSSARRSNTAIW